MLTPEQKIWRRKGIGGSDARTIAFGDAVAWKALRDDKVDGVEPEFPLATQLLMALGHAVEPVCIDYFSANVEPVMNRDIQVMFPSDLFFRCTLDGLLTGGRPLQCKFHTGDRNMENLIEYYWPQLQHELLVTGGTELHFAVVFGRYGRFQSEVVKVDQQFIDGYIARAYQFKAYLDTGKLPDGMTIVPKVSIPRVREHIWPVNDNMIADAAISWISNAEAAKAYDAAAKTIKDAVPEDAKAAKWVRDGVGVKVSVDKRGAKKIAAIVEKAS